METNARPDLGDWTPDEFRRAGHATVEWVARYFESLPALPVAPRVVPREVASQIPAEPPREPEPFDALLEDLDRIVVPGLTHWNHPGFLAYFGITGSAPGVLAELVASAFNTNGMLWRTSPATTEVELVVLRWLLDLFDLPRSWFGFLADTASVSTLLALGAAREAVTELDLRREGLAHPGYPRLRLYASEHAHSSVEKSAIALGLGQVGLRKIPADEQFSMDPRALGEAVREDRAQGWRPFAVVATVGTTASTSVDPVPAIADLCEREGLWLHVDAAYAGAAAVLPEKRGLFAGCSRADSYVVNPHKWLFVPIDASALYTRHPEVLRRAFQLVPTYLQSDDEAVNLMDYGVQLGRRFRGLKLWWVLRSFGADGIASRIREHCRLAADFADWVDAQHRFVRAAPVPFSTVCFRGVWPGCDPEENDRRNEALCARVTGSGVAFLAHTRLAGRVTVRVAIGNLRTDEARLRDVRAALVDTFDAIAGERF